MEKTTYFTNMPIFKVNDSTTLHLAAAGGHADVAKFLLESGASAKDEDAVII